MCVLDAANSAKTKSLNQMVLLRYAPTAIIPSLLSCSRYSSSLVQVARGNRQLVYHCCVNQRLSRWKSIFSGGRNSQHQTTISTISVIYVCVLLRISSKTGDLCCYAVVQRRGNTKCVSKHGT